MKNVIAAALTALALGATAAPVLAQDHLEVGLLSCDVEGGVGLILGSSKDMVCEFERRGQPTETYTGTINKLGLDIGITGRTHVEWVVFAAGDAPDAPRALAGRYVGGSGEATVGVGLGANWLIGGQSDSFALQPLSVQAQTGLNLSLAIASLTLR